MKKKLFHHILLKMEHYKLSKKNLLENYSIRMLRLIKKHKRQEIHMLTLQVKSNLMKCHILIKTQKFEQFIFFYFHCIFIILYQQIIYNSCLSSINYLCILFAQESQSFSIKSKFFLNSTGIFVNFPGKFPVHFPNIHFRQSPITSSATD